MSGGKSGPGSITGGYWSSTESRQFYVWALNVLSINCNVDDENSDEYLYSVRCVKTVASEITLDNPSDAYFTIPSIVTNKVIDFTTANAWTVYVTGTNTEWCTISDKIGESGGDSQFTINATANTPDTDRTATIIINSDGIIETIELTQYKSTTSISTSIRIGDLMVSDRNVGAQAGEVVYNYSNNPAHADHQYSAFKGGYYTWTEALTACPVDWRLPTKEELEVISNAMLFSDERAYLEDSNGNRCYFPLSGISSNPSFVGGYYWSSTEYDNKSAYLYVSTSTTSMSNQFRSYGLLVRCVKTVE